MEYPDYVLTIKDRDGTVIAEGHLMRKCIHSISVNENYRRKGYGSLIVQKLVAMGGNWLWVVFNCEPAIEMYKKLGFEVIETVHLKTDGELPFIKMRLKQRR